VGEGGASFSRKVDSRSIIQKGPIKAPNPVEREKINETSQQSINPLEAFGKLRQHGTNPSFELANPPKRFQCRRSKTILKAPVNFDPSLIIRSARLPDYDCAREHVFGLSTSLYSNNCIYNGYNDELHTHI
jgi:hypothetical protein